MGNDRPTNLGDIDPARTDVATAPKPKARRRRKAPPMPVMLEPWAERARARMQRRPASPGVRMEAVGDCGDFEPTSPHDNDEVWQLQIHDAFGTRSPSTVRVFIEQLRALCGQSWDDDLKVWRPSETEISAAVNFVNSIQPRNEAEAALAAQMLAVHFMTMKISAQALGGGLFHERTASIAAKLARTYAMQMDVLNRGRGKSRSTRQHITVKHEKHIHTHQHQHVAFGPDKTRGAPGAWTCAPSSSPPSGEIGSEYVGDIEQRAPLLGGSATMPSQDAIGQIVSLAGRKRKAGV